MYQIEVHFNETTSSKNTTKHSHIISLTPSTRMFNGVSYSMSL